MCGPGRALSSCHVYTPMCCVPNGLAVLTSFQILSSCDWNVFLDTLKTILFVGTAKRCWYICVFEMSWLGGLRESRGLGRLARLVRLWRDSFSMAPFASLSALSFPSMPLWAGIHCRSTEPPSWSWRAVMCLRMYRITYCPCGFVPSTM
jgi:hypothetical protein